MRATKTKSENTTLEMWPAEGLSGEGGGTQQKKNHRRGHHTRRWPGRVPLRRRRCVQTGVGAAGRAAQAGGRPPPWEWEGGWRPAGWAPVSRTTVRCSCTGAQTCVFTGVRHFDNFHPPSREKETEKRRDKFQGGKGSQPSIHPIVAVCN